MLSLQGLSIFGACMKDVPMNERTWSTGLLLVTLTLVTCFMSWGIGPAAAAGLEKDHATLLRA